MFKTDVEWYSNYMCFEKKIYWPCNQACRRLTLIVISLKIEKWRPPTLCRKVNCMWNHNETGQNSSHYIDEIIRIVIVNMYITHGILYWDNHNLIAQNWCASVPARVSLTNLKQYPQTHNQSVNHQDYDYFSFQRHISIN